MYVSEHSACWNFGSEETNKESIERRAMPRVCKREWEREPLSLMPLALYIASDKAAIYKQPLGGDIFHMATTITPIGALLGRDLAHVSMCSSSNSPLATRLWSVLETRNKTMRTFER